MELMDSLEDRKNGAPLGCAPTYNMHAEAGTRGVMVTGADHRVQYLDARICELLGIGMSDVLGGDAKEVASKVLKHRFRNPDSFESHCACFRDDPSCTVEDVLELVQPKRILHRYSTPLLDESGKPVAFIEVYSDITKRRELEESNISLYKQICSAYEELKATQDQLLQSEKLRAVGEIASGVAHDFNNTLGIILGNIQLLLRTTHDERARTRLSAVEQAALDGVETVRRIQEFTKVQQEVTTGSVDLSALVAASVEVMRPSWETYMHTRDCHVKLEMELAEEIYAAGVGPEIREVLANILLNAVQSMREGGTLRVSTGRSGADVWLRVADTGTGMTEEVRKRVFDPFFTTKGVEGTGLGMSVVYGIVKRHGGSISIESEPGRGTGVTIFLPAADGESPERQETRKEPEKAQPASILVIDDEEQFTQVFAEMLSECGHAVAWARSWNEASDKMRDKDFDLVFTDLGMPEVSGWQVARNIKEIRPQTPVVLLTGWGASLEEAKLEESKVDMVLTKPIKMEDLSGIITEALSGQSGGRRR